MFVYLEIWCLRWISNIRRADLVGKKTSALRHDKLCGIHFETTQFNEFFVLFYIGNGY